MLIAARAMQSGMAILKPHLQQTDRKSSGKVVIGTVKGDLIVAAVADLISPESVERGEPIRAVDALLVVQALRDSIRLPPIQVDFGPHEPSPNKPPGT